MKLIVGLGNPGKKYERTRHNIGFRIIDATTQIPNSKFQIPKIESKFKTEISKGKIGESEVILAKPQTFMNNSGEAVLKIASFYKIRSQDIWVISDDIDLPLGKIRIRKKGSSGGHKGLQSIIDHLGNQNFPRFRIGIKTPKAEKIPAEDFVLQKFSPSEEKVIKLAVEKVVEEIIKVLKEDLLEEKTITNIVAN